LFGQAGRCFHDDLNDLIPPPRPPQVFGSGSGDPEYFTGLGARPDLKWFDPFQCGNVDPGPQGCLGKGDGYLAIDVISLSLEELMRLHMDDHVEVTRRATMRWIFFFPSTLPVP